ncbi:ComEA family DNA-binding protein [Synergistes jonesii]|mgnify:CR=1 FL=1|uniref:ComEA family DNA-binding protein n=1 Tax=Synergistes jonesii TaxID=2754 RepID=UPI00248D3CF1|nr:ComEA family DNA-binding protein [Synergistes jonesii]
MDRRNSGKVFVAAGVLCFALAFVLLSTFKGQFGRETAGQSSPPEMEEPLKVTPPQEAERSEPRRVKSISAGGEGESRWMVYVTGAVKRPGVYEVSPGARVYEALSAAGGFADGADQEAVNLAAKLEDGEHVKFLRKGELQSQSAAAPAQSYGSQRQAIAAVKVNINTAGRSELRTINGVGEKTAQMIIDYRTKNGKFARVEDVMNIGGIGAKRYEMIKDQITVGN